MTATVETPMTSATPTAPSCDIPSINLKPFFEDKGAVIGQPPTSDQLKVAQTIHHACQEHGFVHVTNFGFTTHMGQALFQASKDLFANPTKQSDYQPWSPATNIGFSPYQNETLNSNRQPDLKEAFNIRFPPKWTIEMQHLEKLPSTFQSVIRNVYQDGDGDDDGGGGGEVANNNKSSNRNHIDSKNNHDYNSKKSLFHVLRTIAQRYAIACAVALGLPPTTFSKTLQTNDLCTLRFLHYPACATDATSSSSSSAAAKASPTVAIRAGEHTDFGAFTFLFLGSQGPLGLQVKSVEGGAIGGSAGGENDDTVQWRDVVMPPSGDDNGDGSSFGAVINTGAMLARWTNDHWKATAHRVIVPDEAAAAQDRYSIAFFVDPDADELIQVDKKFVRQQEKDDEINNDDPNDQCFVYEPITSRDFILMKLQEMADGAKK